MFIRKVVRYLLNSSYDKFSAISKRQFSKRKYYRYRDEIFFSDRSFRRELIDKYSIQSDAFWENQQDYSISNHFMERYAKQFELVFEKFLPNISREATIADVGCAGGEWSFKVLPYVTKVEGYEYSEKLVETAKRNAKERKANNITFYCADARKAKFSSKYEGVMMLGMLMYIDNVEDIYKILVNVYNSLKQEAYLVTKDTLNCENEDVVFMLNRKNGYESVYWSKERYYEQFIRAGFVLVDELLLGEVSTRNMHFISQGAVWKKM